MHNTVQCTVYSAMIQARLQQPLFSCTQLHWATFYEIPNEITIWIFGTKKLMILFKKQAMRFKSNFSK